MSLSTTNTLTLADTIAYALYNINQTLVVNTNTAITGILNGLVNGSPSMLTDIVNFLDAGSETILLPVASTTANQLTGRLITATSLPTYYPDYYPLLDAFETVTGGLASFLAANNLQVAQSFATIWNTFVSLAPQLNLRPAFLPISPISAAQVFPDTVTDLGSIAIGGSSVVPINTLDGSLVAPQALSYRISTVGSGARSTTSTIQVTYTPTYNAAPATISFTPSTSLTLNTPVALGVNGLEVTALSVTSLGDDADFVYTIAANPPRSLSY